MRHDGEHESISHWTGATRRQQLEVGIANITPADDGRIRGASVPCLPA